MKETVKKMMGICNTDFDTIIDQYIESAKHDLIAVGVDISLEADASIPALVQTAIISYCLSLLDIENADLYTNAYALQKDQLRHYEGYIE